jgi:hypothetical protein
MGKQEQRQVSMKVLQEERHAWQDPCMHGSSISANALPTRDAAPRVRPTSALLSKREHVMPPQRPVSAHAVTAVQRTAGPVTGLTHCPQFAWACGNVHGTGHMLGPIIPRLRPSTLLGAPDISEMYDVPPRRAPYHGNLRLKRIPGATTTQLLRSTLCIQVFDRLLDRPIPGATILVVDARSFADGKTHNSGSTATRNTKSDIHGIVRCRVLANYRQVLAQVPVTVS